MKDRILFLALKCEQYLPKWVRDVTGVTEFHDKEDEVALILRVGTLDFKSEDFWKNVPPFITDYFLQVLVDTTTSMYEKASSPMYMSAYMTSMEVIGWNSPTHEMFKKNIIDGLYRYHNIR